MSTAEFPRVDRTIVADDGDQFTFCSTCAFSHACLSQGMDKSQLLDLHMLVEHVGPVHAGEHVFREGDPFEAIAAVRAGTVKTYRYLDEEEVSAQEKAANGGGDAQNTAPAAPAGDKKEGG